MASGHASPSDRRLGAIVALALTALVCAPGLLAEDASMTMVTERPGNVFVDGQRPTFAVRPVSTEVMRYEVVDYWERTLARGEVKAEGGEARLRLGVLPRGYYELTCIAGDERAMAAFAVIADRKGAGLPENGRLAVDGATAWLSKPEQWPVIAKMLRLAGIPWVRERLSWGQVEPERGEFAWGRYDTVATAFAREGIHVYQIFHDSPGWSHEGRRGTRCPDDMRDVYRFARAAGEHFKGRIQAWEVWNEPDIGFWPDLSDRFSGVQKAAYLGFHDSGARTPVLLASLCRGPSRFADALFESGIADYFDIFNYHEYADPTQAYPRIAERYLDVIERFGCGDRPVWVTEAGIRLREHEGSLTREDQRRQAEFVPKSFAMSLASGADRHFFFVLPHYLERGIQFGALRPDCTPYPAYVAIAAAVNILGEARYLGEYPTGDDRVTAQVFEAGRDEVMVIWSAEESRIEIPLEKQRVRVADLVGNARLVATEAGALRLEVGPSPQYVVGVGEAVLGALSGEVRPVGRLPNVRPSRIVAVGYAAVETINKDENCYLIGSDAFRLTVDVYNLSEQRAGEGLVTLRLPEGWSSEPSEVRLSLGAMDRERARFTVRPGKPRKGLHSIVAQARWGGAEASRCVSDFKFDLSAVQPGESKALGLNEPSAWTLAISGNGEVAKRPSDDGGVAFDVKFTGPGDRWCYPYARFEPPVDFSRFDGIAFAYRCNIEDADTRVRLQLVESGGPAYLTAAGVEARHEWRRVVFPFDELVWGAFSAQDPNRRLDLGQISAIRIGVNTRNEAVTLEVRDVTLVRF
ncbi:MAG: hypothetical protein ACE5O2_01185 [Armatimonadota bacterium]